MTPILNCHLKVYICNTTPRGGYTFPYLKASKSNSQYRTKLMHIHYDVRIKSRRHFGIVSYIMT